MTADAFTPEDEVMYLCAGAGITIEWYTGGGRAIRSRRLVRLSPVRGEVSYLVALHEIGHVLGSNPPLRLDQEVAAWEWALDHYDQEPTSAAWRSIAKRLDSYRRSYERPTWDGRPSRRRVTDRFLRFLDRVELAAEIKTLEETDG